jgi:hypothetical protein
MHRVLIRPFHVLCFNSSVRTNNRIRHNTPFRATRPDSLLAVSTRKLARNYTANTDFKADSNYEFFCTVGLKPRQHNTSHLYGNSKQHNHSDTSRVLKNCTGSFSVRVMLCNNTLHTNACIKIVL